MMDQRYGLGRLHAVDERDKAYPLRALLGAAKPLPAHRYYQTGAVLDQGALSQCVAYAWTQWLQSAPIMDKTTPAPQEVYDLAQTVDEWPGPPPPYDGTSVRAGAKVLQGKGYIAAYHWTGDANDARDYLLGTSTVVVGTDWTNDAFVPDAKGYLHFDGPVAGGHAYLLCGYSTERKAFRMVNSWSRAWGQAGKAWIAHDTMQRLLDRNGECCAALEARH
jgi:hypothetical protein